MIKVIIAGSRDFNDYTSLESVCLDIFESDLKFSEELPEIEIVSGMAKGADSLGETFAENYDFKLKQFPALWDIFGKSAGFKRNERMARYADVLIAFWDGESKGTKHMINLAETFGLKVFVIEI